MKKFAAIYPQTAVQIKRRRNLLIGGFCSAAVVEEAAAGLAAGDFATGFGAGGVATAAA
jgi:hypothetical protein